MKVKFSASLFFLFFLTKTLSISAQWRFSEHAHEAKWESSTIDRNSNALHGTTNIIKFGKRGTEKGEANLLESTLEDNSSQYVLFTHPKWSKNGTIKGWFPSISRLSEDLRLKGQFGFVKPNGQPSTDGARFLIYAHYYIDGQETWEPILDKYKKYTGKLETFDISLDKYKNKKIYFELRVDAGENSSQDWAAWINPRIENKNRHNRQKKLKLTFLGAGYKRHNDDCSRLNLNITTYAFYTKNPNLILVNKKILPDNLDTQLIKWDKQEKRNVWIKRNIELVSNKFEINASNFHQLKSKQNSQIFSFDQSVLSKGRLRIYIRNKVESCHKSCDLCTDFNCNLRGGIGSSYNIKDILKGNSFGYFSSIDIPINGHAPVRTYFKVEIL